MSPVDFVPRGYAVSVKTQQTNRRGIGAKSLEKLLLDSKNDFAQNTVLFT